MTISPLLKRRLRVQAALHGRGKRRKPPRWFFPSTAERKYKRLLQGYVDRMERIFRETVEPRIAQLAAEARASKAVPDSRKRGDAWQQATAQLLANYRITIEQDRPARLREMAAMAGEISAWNKGQWSKVITSTLGIDIFQQEPWIQDELAGWIAENTSLITSLEDEGIAAVDRLTSRGIRTGTRHEEISKDIYNRFEVTKSRANLIARDQTAKLNGDLTKARQESMGVTHYIWRTSGDDRVRPTHRHNNGKRFSWDDPPAETGHPGQDYQCRCGSDPDLSGLLAALDEVQ